MFWFGSYMLSLIEAKVEKQGRPCWAQDKSHLHSSQVWLMCLQIHTALCITLMLIYITMIRKVLNKHIMFVVFLWFDSTRPQLGRKCPREKHIKKVLRSHRSFNRARPNQGVIFSLAMLYCQHCLWYISRCNQGAARSAASLPPTKPPTSNPQVCWPDSDGELSLVS